jgi:hypothetical protein
MNEQTVESTLEKAKRRFPRALAIEGDGPFCVVCCPDKIVRLFDTFLEHADYISRHPGSRAYDFKDDEPSPVRKMNAPAPKPPKRYHYPMRDWQD